LRTKRAGYTLLTPERYPMPATIRTRRARRLLPFKVTFVIVVAVFVVTTAVRALLG